MVILLVNQARILINKKIIKIRLRSCSLNEIYNIKFTIIIK